LEEEGGNEDPLRLLNELSGIGHNQFIVLLFLQYFIQFGERLPRNKPPIKIKTRN
jgi:hypothetical protein